ncbi:MAG: DNA mismatch repair protein MutS [Clostridia bacterium]|nr:DNA mismatch repair protein MutS [Clostridia bacterium]
MMEQYFEIKNQYKDYLLFYRLGDFYEMFFDDAILASRELELTLTGRDCGESERAPMCGVPFHSAEMYIGKLISKNYKVAICEQTEDPSKAKGLVKREVIRVITPGTVIESTLLSEQRNNYLCSLYIGEFRHGVCFCDVSTGEIYATSIGGDAMDARLQSELGTYAPSEVVSNLTAKKMNTYSRTADFITGRLSAVLTENQPTRFEYEDAKALCTGQFGESLKEETLQDRALVSAVGALLSYLAEMQKKDISYIRELRVYSDGQYLEMDMSTRRNLELTETMRSKEKKGSLLWVLDKTVTAAGARLLRKWVEHPLINVARINERQGAIEELANSYMKREELSELLRSVLDLERLITKIVYGTANAKDLRAIAVTASVLPEIKALLADSKSPELSKLYEELDLLEDISSMIEKAIVDDPPFLVREGGMIREGYNADVDYLRSIAMGGKSWIEQMTLSERERTGIKNLKIGYNKVFGYYIEVTNSYKELVPSEYIRKQTLVGAERYITDELKTKESEILGASDRLWSLEYELFQEIRSAVAREDGRIQKTAALLATLDVYLSLANVATRNHYVRPEVDQSDKIEIKDGRHPVVEQFVKDTYFVPNDAKLDLEKNRLMLITGPNMAGKSTYMRQVALITVMAQIGSFVPAAEARIGIVDKVFTRVGASDDLASGQSTFMLEMNEVAYILQNATRKSLIIYDEVGRGTSTFDGMSIARAIVEYTCSRKIGAKTLFATHYHELTTLEEELEGVVNYNIAAKKRGDNITFLRKIVRGSTDDSYGIEVAKLAGVPNEVIRRAKEILRTVEASARALSLSGDAPKEEEKDDTLITFDDCISEQVIDELKKVDLNTLSPFECMTFLFNLQKRLK